MIHLSESLISQDYLVILAYGREFLGTEKWVRFKLVDPKHKDRVRINETCLLRVIEILIFCEGV